MGTQAQEAALQNLHDRHASDLWRFALRLTHDRELAQDVVQETLLRAWRDPALAARPDPVARAWLFTIARHLVIDKWRSAASRHEVGGITFDPSSGGDATSEVLDRWLIADALRQLSEDHRAVITAAYFEGRSVADIAASLGVPVGTVKSRLHYGLRTLRLILQEKGVTQP